MQIIIIIDAFQEDFTPTFFLLKHKHQTLDPDAVGGIAALSKMVKDIGKCHKEICYYFRRMT